MKGYLIAYSVFRFSAGPGTGRAAVLAEPTASFDMVQSGPLLALDFSSHTPAIESRRKDRLKTKCTLNPMFLSTPPQLQGTLSNTFKSTSPMYIVNASIKVIDP